MPVRDAGRAQGNHLEQAHVYNVYDQIAPKFNEISQKAWPHVRRFLKDLKPGSLVADIGCGTGRYLHVNSKIIKLGVDICYPLVECVRTKGHEVLVADNLKLPFRDATFDAVISIGVIHHFATQERRLDAIKELSRILVPGGQLMIYVWAFEQRHRRFDGQDVLIPWHGGNKSCKRTSSIQSTCSDRDVSSTTSSLSEDDSPAESPTSRSLLRTISDPLVGTGSTYPLDSYLSNCHDEGRQLSNCHRSNTLPGSLEAMANETDHNKPYSSNTSGLVQEFIKFEASLVAMSSSHQSSNENVAYQQDLDEDVFCSAEENPSLKKNVRNFAQSKPKSMYSDKSYSESSNNKITNGCENDINYIPVIFTEKALKFDDSATRFLNASLPYDAYKSLQISSVQHSCDICPSRATLPRVTSDYISIEDPLIVSGTIDSSTMSKSDTYPEVPENMESEQESNGPHKKSKFSFLDTLKENFLNFIERKSSQKKKHENSKHLSNGSNHHDDTVAKTSSADMINENSGNLTNGSSLKERRNDNGRIEDYTDVLKEAPSDFAVREFPLSSCPAFRKELQHTVRGQSETRSNSDLHLSSETLSTFQSSEYLALEQENSYSKNSKPSKSSSNLIDKKSKLSSSSLDINGSLKLHSELGQGHRSASLSNCSDINYGERKSVHVMYNKRVLQETTQTQKSFNSHSDRTSHSLSSLYEPSLNCNGSDRELSPSPIPFHHLFPMKRRQKEQTVFFEKKKQITKEVPLRKHQSCDKILSSNYQTFGFQETDQTSHLHQVEKDLDIVVPCRSVTTKAAIFDKDKLTTNSKELSRFYHVFKDGELSDMISNEVKSLRVVSCTYDHANWCVVAEKLDIVCKS